MKKTTLWTVAIVAGVAVLALTASLLIQPAESVDACFECTCDSTIRTTASQTVGGENWTGGADCNEARNQLLSNLLGTTTCPTCVYQLMITEDCQMDDPKWYPVTGYLQYQCWP